MKIEKVEMVCISVNDLNEAMEFYERFFDTKFKVRKTKNKWALCPFGFELLERPVRGPETDTVRSFHLKVPDVYEVKEEMKTKGFEPVEEVQIPDMGLREVVYHVRGLRIIFIDWKGRS